MSDDIWKICLSQLKQSVASQHFTIYLSPLQAELNGDQLTLLAPNKIVHDTVVKQYGDNIQQLINLAAGKSIQINYKVGTRREPPTQGELPLQAPDRSAAVTPTGSPLKSGLNEMYTFEQFVEGKSNQLARAAALYVAENPGSKSYNPFFIYGNTGLGKTHLMHAIGHEIKRRDPAAKVLYIVSEKFVADYVSGIHHNKMDDFKKFYRSLDALLIDDIQFFAGKDSTQEEFFHTFNTLLEGQKQIILTCDTLPQGVGNIDDRLRSRFTWGLSMAIEPPELETRVAILKRKAENNHYLLPDDVAFFIAENVRSHVRDLEGALSRVHANAQFRGENITLEYAREALRDQLAIKAKQVTVENIQRVVADYFDIRLNDLLSAKRNRSIARPRQIAMALAKELTKHSLPEIGKMFGGRDHTTVMHACKQIKAMRDEDSSVDDSYNILLRKISS